MLFFGYNNVVETFVNVEQNVRGTDTGRGNNFVSKNWLDKMVPKNWNSFTGELTKFVLVGGGAFLVDVSIFNILLHWGPIQDKPVSVKLVSSLIAIIVAYMGNRLWTFKIEGDDLHVHTPLAQMVRFLLVNGVAVLLAVGCLGVSRYVFGFNSGLADNISANVIGIILGMFFRFYGYKRWVFPSGS